MIDGGEFGIISVTGGYEFTYMLGDDDPALTHFVKQGNGYAVYDGSGTGFGGFSLTDSIYTGSVAGEFSKIGLYDAGASVPPHGFIPVPVAAWLLLGGLGGLGALRMRRKARAQAKNFFGTRAFGRAISLAGERTRKRRRRWAAASVFSPSP